MFNRCDFLLGENQSIVIVVPETLPVAETYTISLTEDTIRFMADYKDLVDITYSGGEIYKRIANNVQIGLVEYPPGEDFPLTITNVAYVEVRRAM